MKNKINNLINELNTILNWGGITGSLLEDLYYKYSVMSGSLFVEMADLLEDIVKDVVNETEEQIYGCTKTYDYYDMFETARYWNVYINSYFENDIHKLIDKCEKELTLIKEEEVSSQDTSNKKQVILINSRRTKNI